ncbi:MAG: NAD-dependent epimerase/dehydratase family protein, partial [Armatimonadetes bacterium]|nr:NAD-dependent epimerase/dehydratase family protein [Armatimonadota bacterium]
GHVGEIRGDRHGRPEFEDAVRRGGPFDCVIDMICFKPDDAESTVRACRGICAQVVFCSTVDVYRRPWGTYPYREGGPLHSLSDYGRKKVLCEHVFERAHADGDFAVTILRPAHTYCDSGTIVHSMGWSTSLLDRMRKGKPVIVHGDGQSLWTSAHADDVATGFVGAIGNTRAYGRGYHLTGEEWLTWDMYHATVAEALGVPLPEIVHIPTDLLARIAPRRAGVCAANFQYCNVFDTTQAREDLGYRYTVSVRRGFERVIRRLDADGGPADSDAEPDYDTIIEAWRALSAEMEQRIGPMED